MVHRLLAVAIGADASYPNLLDKKRTQVCVAMLKITEDNYVLFVFFFIIPNISNICVLYLVGLQQFKLSSPNGTICWKGVSWSTHSGKISKSKNKLGADPDFNLVFTPTNYPWNSLTFSQIFFKNRVLDEDGYILSVRKNALQILIPKYGLEGTIFLSEDKTKSSEIFSFDEEVSVFFIKDVF